MQRTDPDGLVLLCDFCRRDWDGQEPMIEGHHGSILCLQCLKQALTEQSTGKIAGADKFKCTLCLRFNIPISLPHWSNPEHSDSIVCQECLYQAARGFSRSTDNDWTFDPAKYPPAIKLPKPPKPEPEPDASPSPEE